MHQNPSLSSAVGKWWPREKLVDRPLSVETVTPWHLFTVSPKSLHPFSLHWLSDPTEKFSVWSGIVTAFVCVVSRLCNVVNECFLCWYVDCVWWDGLHRIVWIPPHLLSSKRTIFLSVGIYIKTWAMYTNTNGEVMDKGSITSGENWWTTT